TPPITSFFGDRPTIELMNAMGFSADGLGNHNFDKGQAYLRTTLIPLAHYPFLSANVVDANGKTPAEWSPSKVFDGTFGGVKLGVVGFTNDDAPTLVSPNAFTPFHVANSLDAVNAEAARLKAKGIGPIVAIGHHTDFQVLTTRPNGVLVTENRSKGIRFTCVRLLVDTSTKQVVYRTADFHKPWDIGVTADPAIQARIDALNAQL